MSPTSAASGHRSAHDAPEQAACQALTRLYTDHYRTLVRLAALLTGDAGCAEDVVVDAYVALCSAGRVEAGDRALSYLRRQVVIRSRRAAASRPGRVCATSPAAGAAAQPCVGGCTEGPANGSEGCRFGTLPVVLGLMTLRPAQREAIVLTGYLDLPERQAAAVAGMTQAALRRHLASASQMLGSWPSLTA
jgi:DNA-directed RNA polymerase specialized sigma24 family protein